MNQRPAKLIAAPSTPNPPPQPQAPRQPLKTKGGAVLLEDLEKYAQGQLSLLEEKRKKVVLSRGPEITNRFYVKFNDTRGAKIIRSQYTQIKYLAEVFIRFIFAIVFTIPGNLKVDLEIYDPFSGE